MHLAHVPQAAIGEAHAIDGDEVGLVEENDVHGAILTGFTTEATGGIPVDTPARAS